jgi:hypothetical protein
MTSIKRYLTLDNGKTPFRVSVQGTHVSIEKQIDDQKFAPFKTYDVEHVFIGKSPKKSDDHL